MRVAYCALWAAISDASRWRRLGVPMLEVADLRRPRVTPILPERYGRRGKRGIVECADRNAEARRSCLAGPANGDPAVRAEMVVDPGACVAGAGVNLVRSIETNIFFWKVGVAGPGHAGTSLAVAAMADIDISRLARGDDAKLTAKALRGSFHHSSPMPRYSSATPRNTRARSRGRRHRHSGGRCRADCRDAGPPRCRRHSPPERWCGSDS